MSQFIRVLDVSATVRLRKHSSHAATGVKFYGIIIGLVVGVGGADLTLLAIPIGLGIAWAGWRLAHALRTGRRTLYTIRFLALVSGMVVFLSVLAGAFWVSSAEPRNEMALEVIAGFIAIFGPPAYLLTQHARAMAGYERNPAGMDAHGLSLDVPAWDVSRNAKQSELFAGKRNFQAGLFFAAALMAVATAVLAVLVLISEPSGVIGLLARVVMFGSPLLAALLYRRGRRYAALRASEIRSRDTRPTVLYLRSFRDDRTKMSARAGNGRSWIESRVKVAFEEVIVGHLWRYGPVVAVGEPGDHLPPLGAAREYVSNESWQQTVEQWMTQSQIIAVVVGRTMGLAWEIGKLVDLKLTAKTILLLPPLKEHELTARWKTLCELTGEWGRLALPNYIDAKRTVAVVPIAGGSYVITSEKREDWTYEVALECASELIRSRLRGHGAD